jgi:hypothetical protein
VDGDASELALDPFCEDAPAPVPPPETLAGSLEPWFGVWLPLVLLPLEPLPEELPTDPLLPVDPEPCELEPLLGDVWSLVLEPEVVPLVEPEPLVPLCDPIEPVEPLLLPVPLVEPEPLVPLCDPIEPVVPVVLPWSALLPEVDPPVELEPLPVWSLVPPPVDPVVWPAVPLVLEPVAPAVLPPVEPPDPDPPDWAVMIVTPKLSIATNKSLRITISSPHCLVTPLPMPHAVSDELT